ncbi:AAA family ATPase [Sinimarinibacterium sp. CAU 1509]|uniref:AAA family ATPase n=1 Tax=Sinimarinibacterium sp. CAU 1509 TaxID=2562283 RepID=UPI0010AD4078|nr:AAA family ATPase [Sinimarinibacterium sp. CAU 1509]TJY55766.1 AAA family ATPase [Sinimarinibacterium sp. CAU 1509]
MSVDVRPEDLRKPLPWQAALWLDLTALVLQQQLPHALLLQGPVGIGKRWFARALAAYLVCENRSGYACGSCRSCVQLAVGAHPNALLLGTDGLLGLALTPNGQHAQGLIHWQPEAERKRRDISIDAARMLIERLGISSHYGHQRVAIVDRADALNTASVNALLKTIEEPPPGTQMILISERPQALPATLRSRCQKIRFTAPETEVAQQWLAQQLGHDDADALIQGYGAPLTALQLASGDGVSLRHAWREMWLAVARRRQDPVSAAASVDREALAEHLQWAWSWIAHQFREAVLQRSDLTQRDAFEKMLNEITEALRLSGGNAQPQLLLESLLVSWLRVGPRIVGN